MLGQPVTRCFLFKWDSFSKGVSLSKCVCISKRVSFSKGVSFLNVLLFQDIENPEFWSRTSKILVKKKDIPVSVSYSKHISFSKFPHIPGLNMPGTNLIGAEPNLLKHDRDNSPCTLTTLLAVAVLLNVMVQ